MTSPEVAVVHFEGFDDSLTAFLVKNVTNIDHLATLIRAADLQPEAAIINATLVPDLFVLQVAARLVLSAKEKGALKTRSLHAELVFALAASKHIGESLKRFGVNEGCKHLLVARFNATPGEVERLRGAVHGEPGVLEELAVLSNAEQVRKIYKITAEELQVTNGQEMRSGRSLQLVASLLRRSNTLASQASSHASTTTPTITGSLESWASSLLWNFSRYRQRPATQTFMSFPRRSYGSFNPSSDTVLWSLIAANGVGFLAWRVRPDLASKHAVVSLDALRAGRVWTTISSGFSHADIMHLGSNMISLYFFGRDVGRIFGGRKLLALYLGGAVAGSLAHVGWNYWKERKRHGSLTRFGFSLPSRGALGASAAVNAIVLVDVLMFPTRTILLYGIIPLPAALLGLLWLWNDVGGVLDGHGKGVAHAGHLGGAATGLAFWLAFRRGMIRPQSWF